MTFKAGSETNIICYLSGEGLVWTLIFSVIKFVYGSFNSALKTVYCVLLIFYEGICAKCVSAVSQASL